VVTYSVVKQLLTETLQGICTERSHYMIDEEKKQFKHTGLDAVEVMNDRFSI